MFKPIPISVALLAVALTFASLSYGQSSAALTTIDAPGIENMSILHDSASFAGSKVGFGGATDASAMSWLENVGFRTVINLRRSAEDGANVDSSRIAAEAANLRYVHLPVDPSTVDLSLIDSLVAVVEDTLNQPVYIHCSSTTRVAALWMVARVQQDGWRIELAMGEARSIAAKPSEAIELAARLLQEDE